LIRGPFACLWKKVQRAGIAAEVRRRWAAANTDNIMELSDIAGFRRDFLRIFGFGVDGIDYESEVSPLA
jgi:enoyl-[acyl-carrier protein] reductase/trans-2-enoyl-CoA reductase (NAD+)